MRRVSGTASGPQHSTCRQIRLGAADCLDGTSKSRRAPLRPRLARLLVFSTPLSHPHAHASKGADTFGLCRRTHRDLGRQLDIVGWSLNASTVSSRLKAEAGHIGLRDDGLRAHSRHQLSRRADGHFRDGGLHDHREQSPDDTSARLDHRQPEAASCAALRPTGRMHRHLSPTAPPLPLNCSPVGRRCGGCSGPLIDPTPLFHRGRHLIARQHVQCVRVRMGLATKLARHARSRGSG